MNTNTLLTQIFDWIQDAQQTIEKIIKKTRHNTTQIQNHEKRIKKIETKLKQP